MTTTPTISSELRQVLRRLRLGQILDTLPERLMLAQQQHVPYQDFLELVLVDEIARRDRTSATVRARAARLDAGMVLEAWDDNTSVTFDRQLWAELATLRFVSDAHNVIIMGPVGVGKTHLANALGHIACRRRMSVVAERADRLFKRLKAARLDGSHDAEIRKLIRVDLLLIDEFALQSLDATETADIYEVVVERHRRASTVITSNREPAEWISLMADTLLAQSAVDRLQSAAYELVVEGESYRRRQRPRLGGQFTGPSGTDEEPPAAEPAAQAAPPATRPRPGTDRQ